MSPLGLRASFLLLLGGCLLAAAGRDERVAGSATSSARSPRGGSSGRFISPEHQACSWQLLPSSPGPAVGSELSLRCRGPDGELYQCAYRGEPQRCAAYAARGSHYWKQVLGRLRRKRQPCQDPTPLKARLCAGKKGHGAELRLVPSASPTAGATAADFPPKPRARSRGRLGEPVISPTSRVPPPPSTRSKGKLSQKTKGSKRKVALDPDNERLPGAEPDPHGLNENAKLTETFCAEKWHSLCNFFVSFWNG